MKVLLAHRFLPGQLVHVARALAADRNNEVVALFEQDQGEPPVPGLRGVRVEPEKASGTASHPFLSTLETQVRSGTAAYRACAALRAEGFLPDVMVAHAGSGSGLYLRDAFPEAPLLGYFEWFFGGLGTDLDFVQPEALTSDDRLRRHTTNACTLTELVQCDAGLSPTVFQRAQFPRELQAKIAVVHDGIDTEFFARDGAPERPEGSGVAARGEAEVVTYASRGLEPYRGFLEFMEAVTLLLPRRPRLHVLVAGRDRAYYSRPLPGGKTYRGLALERFPALGSERVRFLGMLPRQDYRDLLHASQVHVYLTAPFVLSWSLVESMAAGCTIVASDTEPVREVLRDGESALLADFHSPAAIAACIERALDDRAAARRLGEAARAVAVSRFALDRVVPEHLELLRSLAARGRQPPPTAGSR